MRPISYACVRVEVAFLLCLVLRISALQTTSIEDAEDRVKAALDADDTIVTRGGFEVTALGLLQKEIRTKRPNETAATNVKDAIEQQVRWEMEHVEVFLEATEQSEEPVELRTSEADAHSRNSTSSPGAAPNVAISLREAHLEPESEQPPQEESQQESAIIADQVTAATEADPIAADATAVDADETKVPMDEKVLARSPDSFIDLSQEDAVVADVSAAVMKKVIPVSANTEDDWLIAERTISSKMLLVASSLLLGMAAFMLLAFCASAVLWGSSGVKAGSETTSPSGAFVQMLEPCSKARLERWLPEAPMDCAHHRPWSSGGPVRLEVRVEEPAGGPLQSPLTKRPCVLFSAGVSQRTHDGMHPVSVAFAQNCVSFEVSLLDAPHIRVSVKGEDVLLFDLEGGRRVATSAFNVAPEHWQTFALTRRSVNEHGGNTGLQSSRNFEGSELDFQECALLVGARVTIVGELHRRGDGRLMLQPCQDTAFPAAQKASAGERWRTSWEKSSVTDQREGSPQASKVLVSDRFAHLQASGLRVSPFRRVAQGFADALQRIRRSNCPGSQAAIMTEATLSKCPLGVDSMSL